MSLNRIVSIVALAATTLGCADDRAIVEPRDSIKVGMTLAETTAILGPPNAYVRFSYGTIPQVVNVDFKDGKVDNVTQQPLWPGRVKQGMTEQQVVTLMGKPDWLTRGYDYGSVTHCAYGFDEERLATVECRSDTQFARRFEAIPLGSSRKTVEHYFGIAEDTRYVYDAAATGSEPRTDIWFLRGRIPKDHPQAGMTMEDVVQQRGKPINICDTYEPNGYGGYGGYFCYDERARLVAKTWMPGMAIP
jgi:hypothetical protein